MKVEIAKRWIEALRLGEYPQGKRRLRADVTIPEKNISAGYCCLGVLCDLAVADGVGEWSSDLESNGLLGDNMPGVWFFRGTKDFAFGSSGTMLPTAVQEWAGIKSAEGILPDGTALTNMNDFGSSFEDIAKVIERSMETL